MISRTRRHSRTLLSLTALTLTSTAFLIPIASAATFTDRDNDNMSDLWERNHGLNVGVDDRFRDPDGDRLTNVAEFRQNTKPHDRDTDDDHINDGREVRDLLTNPLIPDTDRDGLRDGVEVTTYLTNPKVADTDTDGLTDKDEVRTYFTNPKVADTDTDGLSDGVEVKTYLTNPKVADTDGDTLTDGVEVKTYFTNPKVGDTDTDGLTDGVEVKTYLTNPKVGDTDTDGLTDGVEVKVHKTNPNVADTDKDGVNDGAEVAQGTNPLVFNTVEVGEQPLKMKFGVSATSGGFETGYNQQVSSLGAETGYLYGQDPRYVDFDAIPAKHDLWLQTKATTKAAYVTMIASMPATREGKVYLHYFNEPEDQIERGEFTLAQWQQRTDWLYAAIAESGKTYLVPSVEVMYWDLQQTNKGTTNPARQINNYLRPGVKAVGMSAYAEKKVSNGHEVATISATNMPATIKAWAEKVDLPVSIITGWAVGNEYLNDPVTLENRRTWLREAATNLRATGVVAHFMWFDVPWSNGDYRIATDPGLLAVWNSLRAG